MLRVVLDTNIFVSGLISPLGTSGKIIKAWEGKKMTILVTRPILKEIHEVLLRPSIKKYHHLTDSQVSDFCKQIDQFSILLKQSVKLPDISIDPKDLKFLDCALLGKAEFLVTGDKELLVLKKINGTTIISPSAFVDHLK